MKEEILQYYHPDGSLLCEQTVKGVYGHEAQRTREKLAEEHGVRPWEIKLKRKDSNMIVCWTGKSKSGYCRTAAYCSRPCICCAECKESCNIRCGYLNTNPEDESGSFPITGMRYLSLYNEEK